MSEENNNEDLSEQYVFESMSEFYEFLVPTPFDGLEPRFTTFVVLYRNINKGCGCKKKERVSKALEAYRDVRNMSDVSKAVLKENIYTLKIVFKQDGEFLFEV